MPKTKILSQETDSCYNGIKLNTPGAGGSAEIFGLPLACHLGRWYPNRAVALEASVLTLDLGKKKKTRAVLPSEMNCKNG